MFAKSFVALAAVATLVAAAPVAIEQRGAPAGWAYGYLEDYDTYHIRYLALKCQDQKNTTFFADCCRPLLATETLAANRDAKCVPSSDATASVSASLANAGSSASATASADVASESEYCETEESASSAAAATTSSAAATTSSAAAAAATTTSQAGENRLANSPASSSSTTSTAAWTAAATTQAQTTAAATTKASTAAAATTSASSSGETFTGGYATYFYQGGNAGACGTVHSDSDYIVAIDSARWGSSSYGSGSGTCNKWLTITNTNNGKSVVAMIADVCPTCTNSNSLDLSVGAFTAIASESDGMVPISYKWN